MTQLVEELRHKTGGSGFSFKMADSFCPHSVALESTQPRNREISLAVQWSQRVELTALRPCAECHSRGGSPIFHPVCEGYNLLQQSLTFTGINVNIEGHKL